MFTFNNKGKLLLELGNEKYGLREVFSSYNNKYTDNIISLKEEYFNNLDLNYGKDDSYEYYKYMEFVNLFHIRMISKLGYFIVNPVFKLKTNDFFQYGYDKNIIDLNKFMFIISAWYDIHSIFYPIFTFDLDSLHEDRNIIYLESIIHESDEIKLCRNISEIEEVWHKNIYDKLVEFNLVEE